MIHHIQSEACLQTIRVKAPEDQFSNHPVCIAWTDTVSLLFFSHYGHLFLLHHPCSCSTCAAGWWIWPGNLPDCKIWLMFMWPFLQCYFFSWIRVPCSNLWYGSKVCQQIKGNERWECSGESGSSGIWKLWVFVVQWLNIEPCFGTDTFCLPCLLNSYCMWCSINNVFWNYNKPILKEKHSYWISTTIYLPALLPPQWLNILLMYFTNAK